MRKIPSTFVSTAEFCRFVDEQSVEALYLDDNEYPFLDSDIHEAGEVFMSTSAGSSSSLPEVGHTPAKPPQLSKRAEKILLLICPQKSREYILGDLAEEYISIAAKHGARFANLWYWKQVITSVWPFLEWVLKWGLLASTWEWIRKLI